MTDGVAHEACCLVDIQLLHESRAMRFGCFDTDAKQRCDVFGGFPFSDQLEHLPLSQRQRILESSPTWSGYASMTALDTPGLRYTWPRETCRMASSKSLATWFFST